MLSYNEFRQLLHSTLGDIVQTHQEREQRAKGAVDCINVMLDKLADHERRASETTGQGDTASTEPAAPSAAP